MGRAWEKIMNSRRIKRFYERHLATIAAIVFAAMVLLAQAILDSDSRTDGEQTANSHAKTQD